MNQPPPELDERLASEAFVQDPYPVYRDLQQHAPVHRSERWGVWVLTRYDDTLAVLRDHKAYSNAGRFSALLDQLPPDLQDAVASLRRHYSVGQIQSDPPDHTRLRGLVRLAFTPRAIELFRDRVQTITDRLLDDVEGLASFDLVRDVAYKLPVYVISDMLGVPAEDQDHIFTWNRDIAGLQATGNASAPHATRAAVAIDEIETYFGRLVDDHRRSPREDLLSALIQAQDDGDELTRDELISTAVTLLLAGHDTTKNLIANGVLNLIRHKEARDAFVADPAVRPTAIEEILRFESPIQRGWRRVAEDTELRGQNLRAGELVYYMFGAANRDPEVFPDADRFDIRRTANRHLAFGFGIHFCVGAPLARLEGSIALESLFRRFPRLALASDDVTWQPSVHLRCPSELILDARG